MVVRLVLVSMVAGLGLTVPTAEQVVGWKGGAERWVSARIAHWDATMPVGEESFVIVNDPEPIVVREVAQAGPAADPAERPAGTDEVSILRPFNTFGPRQSARAIIPTVISQAISRPVVRLGSLDPRRDLTYVKDTAAGFVGIAGCDAAIGRVVNIGRGSDLTIGELVEKIGRRLGRELVVETETQRVRPAASEVGRLLAGTGLARELWGWEPRYSLDEALDETIAWVRDNLGLFRVDTYTT